LIGNLFAEVQPPCAIPEKDIITINGTTVTGKPAILKIDGDTILFCGDFDDFDKARNNLCLNCQGCKGGA